MAPTTRARCGANAQCSARVARNRPSAAAARPRTCPCTSYPRRPQRPCPARPDDEPHQRRRVHADNSMSTSRSSWSCRSARPSLLLRRCAGERRDLSHVLKGVLTGARGLSHRGRRRGRIRPRTLAPTRRRFTVLVEAIERAGFTPGADMCHRPRSGRRPRFFERRCNYRLGGRGPESSRPAEMVGLLDADLASQLPDRVDRGRQWPKNDWHGWGQLVSAAIGSSGCSSSATTSVRHQRSERLRPRHQRPVGRELDPGQGQPDRHRSPRPSTPSTSPSRHGVTRRSCRHRSGETEDYDDRRPRRRHQLRSDQDRRAGPFRPRGQVQPAPAHRVDARRRCGVPRPLCPCTATLTNHHRSASTILKRR